MVTLDRPRHFPFTHPHRMRHPGLWPLDAADWVRPDAAFAAQMVLRDRLVAEKGAAVCASLPGVEAAVFEFGTALRAHLLRDHRGWRREDDAIRRPDGVLVPDDDGLGALGRLCQEDWLILTAPGPGEGEEYVLRAGALCFPAWWRLEDKIGRPLGAIHAPVPDYDADLARRVNRVFAALRAENPVQRINWSVAPGDRLHTPPGTPEDPGETGPCLRVERQTLRRLPVTGAIVFSVKTELTPLDRLDPGQRASVRAALCAMSPETRRYKMGQTRYAAAIARLN